MDIDAQPVVISGGGSGLGEATARHFAALGARVGILDIDSDGASRVASDIGGYAHVCDVADVDSVATAVSAIKEYFAQGPRVVVNCAGIAPGARIVGREGKLSTELFKKVIEVNLLGSYHVMSYVAQAMTDLPALENGERGVIINTASVAYEDGQLGQVAYAASKGAIASMCLPAAREFSQHGIRVMSIAPGLFETPMMQGLPEDTVAGIAANVPFPKRLGKPVEFAELAADIVRNPYLNGSVIRLDGAVRLPPR